MKKFFKPSKLNSHYLVYDTETGGRIPYTTEPLEFSAIVLDCNTLQQKENTFSCIIQPTDWSLVEDGALKVNNLTRDQILKDGIPQDVFFKSLVEYCRQYQKTDNPYDNLIAVGYNSNNFDNIIMNRLAFKYGKVKDGRPTLFHPMHSFDVMDMLRYFFHNNNELPSYSLDNARQYFGLSANGAHRAMKDVEDTAKIFVKFLEFGRRLTPKYLDKFKNCFGENDG